MPSISAPIIGGAIAGVGSLASGVLGASASESAASTEAAAAQQSAQIQQQMFNTTQANLAPYMAAGGNSLSALMQLLGFMPGTTTTANGKTTTTPTTFNQASSSLLNGPTLAQYQQSPGYQFQLSQGLGAITNNAAATGGINSGNTLKALSQYSQGLANSDFQQFYQNYTGQQTNVFNMLNALTGQGQNAAANLGGLGGAAANSIGNALMSGASASAAGTIGAANAISGGINGASSNALLAALLSQGGGGISGSAAGSAGVGSGI